VAGKPGYQPGWRGRSPRGTRGDPAMEAPGHESGLELIPTRVSNTLVLPCRQ